MKRLDEFVNGFVTGFGWGVGFFAMLVVFANASEIMQETLELGQNVECKE